MPAWLSALATVFLTAVGKIFLAAWQSDQAAKAQEQAAVDQAAATTAQDVAETADAQAANNARSRGTAADVARRLRQRLAGKAGNGS